MLAPTMDRDAALLHGLTARALAELTGCDVSSARRWRRRRRLPEAIARLIELTRDGELGAVAGAWRGWALREGVLISPEGAEFTPGAVRAGPLHVATVQHLRGELAALTASVARDVERRARVTALVSLQNALEQALEAAAALNGALTEGEQTRLFEELTATGEARERLFGSAEEPLPE
jgi:transcriptional regulator with XRE-family HTH domain